MKLVNKLTALMLAIIVLVSFVALPAYAASTSMLAKISCFPYLYHGVENSNGVKALQRFLLSDTNNEFHSEIRADGMDGGFGPHVEDAVRNFQVRHGIYGPNGNGTGEVYNQTWTAIANELSENNNIITKNGARIYLVSKSNSTYSFYYLNDINVWCTDYFARG